jgi:DNA-binding Lrp family transcriptional regulator
MTVQSAIDATDGRLLALLHAEPRLSIMELARRAGVARGTAQARLDRLVARGIVRGFGPEVDPPNLGYPVLAFTTLEIVQAGLDELVEHLSAIPEVLEAHTITGPGDLLCRIVAHSNDHLQQVIGAVLSGPSISRASTHIALSTPILLRTAPLVASAAGT